MVKVKITSIPKDWQDSDVLKVSEKIKTSQMKSVYEAIDGGKGLFTSVWVGQNLVEGLPMYTGYTTFEGVIIKDGKELKGSIIMTDFGKYDGIAHSTNELIAAYGDLEHVKIVKSCWYTGKGDNMHIELEV